MGLGFRLSGPGVLAFYFHHWALEPIHFCSQAWEIWPCSAPLRRFPLWPPCTGHLSFPHQPLNLVGSYLYLPDPELGIPLRESPGSSFASFVFIGLTPDLTLLPFLLQTSLLIPETEKPVPHLPPTPTPLAITTTVTIGRNATVLQVVGKWMSLGQGGGVVMAKHKP